MSTRILIVLVAALLVGGVMTAILKEDEGTAPSAQPTPVETTTPTETPSETMTFDGAAPFESPPIVSQTSTPTGGLPVTGGSSAWPPAFVALGLAGLAALALRRTEA